MRPAHWRATKTPKAEQKRIRALYGKSETKHKLPRFCAARHRHTSANRQNKAVQS